jgi:hypothetical protein
MASTGHRVLDVNNQPIRLDPAASVTIDEHGEITRTAGSSRACRLLRPAIRHCFAKQGTT